MHTLYDKLNNYRKSDYYGFHMPGHKRNLPGHKLPYEIDITEIDGFDDLHHAEGILKDAQERAAKVYSAGETHFLVNGSTVGILSAVLGVTNKGDRILVARNCHKSVYHAIYMNELDPEYLYPGFDEDSQLNTGILAKDVREALARYPDIRAVVLVSPTYDGVVSDIEAIAEAVHEKGLPLIVDEAHGAHFGFHPYFPRNANTKGADIVIHSVHKTLPSLTQTALLHMNGNIADRERVRRYLHMLQSSSPSYVLMAGIDACVQMLAEDGEGLFTSYVDLLTETRKRLSGLRRLSLVGEELKGRKALAYDFDRSKLVISTKHTDMSGRELYRLLLEKYHLQMEMMAGTYVLAMTSVCDTREGMERLIHAVTEIDRETDMRMLQTGTEGTIPGVDTAGTRAGVEGRFPRLPKVCTASGIETVIRNEYEKTDMQSVPYEKSTGGISLEYAYLYPPGIPIVVPGEQITAEAAELLCRYEAAGYSLEGVKASGKIEIIKCVHRI